MSSSSANFVLRTHYFTLATVFSYAVLSTLTRRNVGMARLGSRIRPVPAVVLAWNNESRSVQQRAELNIIALLYLGGFVESVRYSLPATGHAFFAWYKFRKQRRRLKARMVKVNITVFT